MRDEIRHVVSLRLTSDEKALFEVAAKEVGLPLSTWIRTVALASAKKVAGTKNDTRK